MSNFNKGFRMVTPNQLDRRSVLKGITLGAGAVLLQPFLKALKAEAAGQAPPLRIIFLMQGNGENRSAGGSCRGCQTTRH